MATSGRVGLHLFHLLGVVPFLFYVTLSRSAIPDAVFYVLAGLGAILILYHGGKAAYRWYTGSTYWWVNAIHAFYLGPLLLYIGLSKKTAPRASYEALMLFTFAALGYHLKLLADDLAAPYGVA